MSRNSTASILSEDHFHNENAAYDYVEARLWPDGTVCPHCGIKGNVAKLRGKCTRIGLYKCYVCREQFTVKVGTIFESSHLPLRMWLQAIHLLCASKKGISTRQLQRMLRVARKTAWYLGHRIRDATAPVLLWAALARLHGVRTMTKQDRPHKTSAIESAQRTLTDADRHKPDDPEQSKRFIEAARLAEAAEDPKAFDYAFDRIDVKAKTPKTETRRKPTSS